MVADERIGDILVARGNLTREEAEAIASERLRSDTRYASIALRTGRVTIDHALEALAAKSGYPPRDLAKIVIPCGAKGLPITPNSGSKTCLLSSCVPAPPNSNAQFPF